MAEETVIDRVVTARRGRRLEYFTIAWNCLEGVVAIIAGLVAGSISLVGFGIDSFIEVTSGATLLWRMSVDADVDRRERNERLALRIDNCVYLSAILLGGLLLNVAFGLWWADPVAALVMAPIIAKEGLEGIRGEMCHDCSP